MLAVAEVLHEGAVVLATEDEVQAEAAREGALALVEAEGVEDRQGADSEVGSYNLIA